MTYVRTESQDPSQSQLRCVHPLFLRYLIQPIYEFEVLVESVPLEPWQTFLEGAFRDVLGRLVRACDETPAERRVSVDGDFVLSGPRDGLLDVLFV
jgi:hypothetical protein